MAALQAKISCGPSLLTVPPTWKWAHMGAPILALQGSSAGVEAGLKATLSLNTHRKHPASLKSSVGMSPMALAKAVEHSL